MSAAIRMPRLLATTALVLAITATLLLAMGRPPICTCGHVAFWHGGIDAGTSQHLLDWYSPSHLVHGLIFYAAAWSLLGRHRLEWRFLAALLVEAGWELVENTPMAIDRYRTATAALGYTGDSVLNSMSDIGCMMLGFLLASRLPSQASVALGLGLEVLTLATIRDDLTLNVLMLLRPIAAIRRWQAALP